MADKQITEAQKDWVSGIVGVMSIAFAIFALLGVWQGAGFNLAAVCLALAGLLSVYCTLQDKYEKHWIAGGLLVFLVSFLAIVAACLGLIELAQ